MRNPWNVKEGASHYLDPCLLPLSPCYTVPSILNYTVLRNINYTVMGRELYGILTGHRIP